MNEAVEALKDIRNRHYAGRCLSWKEWGLYIALGLFVVSIFAAVLGLLGFGMVRQRAYWDYVEELSESTTHSYEQGGVWVTAGDETYLLTGEDVYIPYKLLGDITPGRPWEEEPAEAENILFTFADGTTLQIWSVPIEDSTKGFEYGLYIRYCNSKGEVYQFDLDGMTIRDVKNGLNRRKGLS